ncbi:MULTISPECIES: CPBP family intramembrane glutamic endopeptidase [unclassified Treponema]|uniref:CPBP family intramembrane glutamic endopeptidase n=1 Tax=unclassified Treponema TaxID=2638727 RepID=UPI0020A4A70B|nr:MULTISPECIES: type II CAAX endopeptidase family protein [unclassified Treponema]UTC67617.1 CPBP family intramembrane metalloprotease [Treponema sp. OMZ 789]UTC70345.1 CPBP family intramembrane metalloprotease [Treponema sp. OMZ 790]UTC73059.1 CPBP family intramembrane metalloprotease [Treponema sp. OMZ 791]
MNSNIKKAFLNFWWLSSILLFLILWKSVQILNPDMSILNLKKRYLYGIIVIVDLYWVICCFKINRINVKEYFKFKNPNFLLILKYTLIVLAISEIYYQFNTLIPDIKYSFNFFKENMGRITYYDVFRNPNLWNYVLICGMIFAPVAEELFFRYYMYNNLKYKYSSVFIANIISSVIFGLFHISMYGYDLNAVMMISMGGMALAYCYEKTRTIWTPMIMHSLHNGLVSFGQCLTTPFFTILTLTYIILGGSFGIIELIKYLKRRKTFNEIQTDTLPNAQK